MGEEFLAHIKLISGEEILANVCVDETNEQPVLIVNNPVVMKMLNNPNGNFIKIKPWMELSHEDVFVIHHDKIIAMSETSDPKIKIVYEKFLKDQQDDAMEFFRNDGKVDMTEKMGYISNVNDARKYLEDMYNKPIKEG